MYLLLSHVLYAAVMLYGYKVSETYRAQKALGVHPKQAIKNALVWPKYLG